MRCALGDYPPPVSQWRRRLSACVTVGISSTFCDGFVVQCVKLMPSKFLNLWFLLFDCFVCCQNVTCLQRFNQVWALHRSGEKRNHSQTRRCFLHCCAKIRVVHKCIYYRHLLPKMFLDYFHDNQSVYTLCFKKSSPLGLS